MLDKQANRGKTLLTERDVDNILQVGKQHLVTKPQEIMEKSTHSPFLKSVQKNNLSPYADHIEDFQKYKRSIITPVSADPRVTQDKKPLVEKI